MSARFVSNSHSNRLQHDASALLVLRKCSYITVVLERKGGTVLKEWILVATSLTIFPPI